MSRDRAALRIPDERAALLGLVQGPTELLPVSSSAHISLVPFLAGWEWQELDAEARKSFEVALHGGTALALLISLRHEIADELGVVRCAARERGGALVRASRRRGSRLRAQDRGARHPAGNGRRPGARGDRDGPGGPARRGRAGAATPVRSMAFCSGIAQACALVPGVSRNGATLTAARARRFGRDQANLLSRTVALPVILGAVGLKGTRLAKRGSRPAPAGRSRSAGPPPSRRRSPRSA